MSEVQFELAKEGIEAREPREPGRFAEAATRFRRNRMAVIGVVVIVLIVLACAVGPFLVPYDPSAQDYDAISMAPSWAHPFGTDDLGRDLLARVLIGGRLSLFIGVVATLVALVIGVLYGAVAGFFGGWVDQLMMRVVDVLYSLPFLFFVIMLTMVVGRGVPAILLAIGALLWLTVAVIVRGQALSLRNKEFVEAARAGGMKPFAIVGRHIVPNSLGPVIAYASLLVPGVIMGESFLSYLGLGIAEPAVTWGTLISDGTGSMDVEPWKIAFPAAALALTLLSLNFIADGLRDALDPKDR